MDIWMSKKIGDTWGDPINLGPTINTESDEVFPYIHADGSLFFASNGLAGFGGLDIFFSRQKGTSWGKPNNLGAPFNSENDDFGYIIDRDKKNGYFSSNRGGGFGEDDIYSFYITGSLDEDKPLVIKKLTLVIADAENQEMIEGAEVTYTNLDNLSLAKALTTGNESESILQQLSEEQNRELLVRVPLDAESISGETDNWGKFPANSQLICLQVITFSLSTSRVINQSKLLLTQRRPLKRFLSIWKDPKQELL